MICFVFGPQNGFPQTRGAQFEVDKWTQMTRRAFLSSRVIQAQGTSRFNMLVKNWGKWVRKIKISQNLWIQLTREQFSYLRQVKTYPGIQLLCLSMRLREFPMGAKIFLWHQKSRDFHENSTFLKSRHRATRKLLGGVGRVRERIGVRRNNFSRSNMYLRKFHFRYFRVFFACFSDSAQPW